MLFLLRAFNQREGLANSVFFFMLALVAVASIRSCWNHGCLISDGDDFLATPLSRMSMIVDPLSFIDFQSFSI